MNAKKIYQKLLVLGVISILILISFTVIVAPTLATPTQDDTRAARVDVDVGIDGVGDVTGTTKPEHFPGQPITLNCTVRNYLNETIPQAFEVVFTINDNVPDIPGYNYKDNQTVYPWMLPKLGTVNLTWNWTPPLHAPPGGSWNFSEGDHTFTANFFAIYDGDINSANTQMDLDVIIKKPDFQIHIASGWNNVPEPIKTITIVPGTVTKFPLNFTVFNKRKETWCDFNVTTPTEWQASNPPPKFFTTNSNSSNDNLSLIVFPAIKREFSPTQTELPIILKGTCRRYPFAVATWIFKVKIAFIPYPDIITPVTKTAQPSEVYCDFNVVNDGNGQDSFMSEATVGQTPFEMQKLAEQGWKAIVHSGKFSPILERGDSHLVRVKVTIPSTVPAGSPALINLTVHSEKATFTDAKHPYAIQSGFFYMYSGKMKNVDVQDKISSINMKPNSEATIPFTVRNVGNGIDNTITVNVTEVPENWKAILDRSDIPFIGLGRQAVADIELTIKTPKEVTVGTYTIKVAGIAEDDIKDTSEITVNVLKVRKVDLLCRETKQTGNVSERLEYIISVRNLGNSHDTVDLNKEYLTNNMGGDWNAELSKETVSLYPYQTSDVILTVDIPIDALADTDSTTLRDFEPYEIEVQGVSQNDTSVKDTAIMEIYVAPIYNFRFSKESDVVEMISGGKSSISYEIELQNLGNTWDQIDFDYDGETWDGGPIITTWTSLPLHKSSPPGQIDTIIFSVDPPADIPIGDYVFTITGTSKGDKSVEHNFDLTVRVINSDLAISEIRFNGKTIDELGRVSPNEVLLISVDIQNVGDLIYLNTSGNPPYGKLFIEFNEEKNYIGDRNITYLATEAYDPANSVVTLSMSWSVGKLKSYTIIVLLDPGKNFPDSNRDNNRISDTVIVYIEGSGETEAEKEASTSEIYMIALLIIILVIILLIGLKITLSSLRRAKRAGYTETGEYKPYEEREEITFDKDDETDGSDEFEVPSDRPYKKGGLKGGVAIITTHPIRKTKPISKIKPISDDTSLELPKGEPPGRLHELPESSDAPGGYLPPHSDSEEED